VLSALLIDFANKSASGGKLLGYQGHQGMKAMWRFIIWMRKILVDHMERNNKNGLNLYCRV